MTAATATSTVAPLTTTESELLRDPGAWEVFQTMGGHDDRRRPSVRAIAKSAALPVHQVHLILNHMAALRLATYGPVVADNGQHHGFSWWLTHRGTDLRSWFAENGA